MKRFVFTTYKDKGGIGADVWDALKPEPKTSPAQLAAGAKYDKEHTKTYCLKLNLKTDADLIAFLGPVENKNGFIKKALRAAAGLPEK